jgi:predicted O-linked N-acetylglucosamine transferase (SPINDLY family)
VTTIALPARFAALAHDAAVHAGSGDLEASATAWRAALAVLPAHAEAWHNLGIVEARRGRLDDAARAFDEAARLRPDWAEPCRARGCAQMIDGDLEGAVASFERALLRDPAHVAARLDLAQARIRQRRYSLALPQLSRARALAPAEASAWWLLRGTLLALGREEEALQDLLAFQGAGGTGARVDVAALASARRLGDAAYEARSLAAALAAAEATSDAGLVSEVLALVQYHDVDSPVLLRLYDAYDRLVRAEMAARGERQVEVAAALDGRMSVAYLSADFRGHVMGELFAPIVEAHDRTRHRFTLFSLAPPGHDDTVTARFRAAADEFVDLSALDDAAAAKAIAARGVDVLVDLMGHSAFARPAILARKPARRIVTHLGYHGAVGLASVDAKLSDPVADLPDGAGALRERVLFLDGCVLPLRAGRAPVARYDRAGLGIAADAVSIAAFVPAQKLSPRCLALWRAVLERVPRARLLFSPPRDDERIALVRRVEGFGIDPARVAFVPYDAGHLHDRYAVCDLALDTLPYSGGDTTAAALAAGVPVVTRIGARHAERMSASILTHAGLADLVAPTDEAFVELASRIAGDDAWREAMHRRVREAFAVPSLTDPARYADSLERAYARVLIEPPREPPRSSH